MIHCLLEHIEHLIHNCSERCTAVESIHNFLIHHQRSRLDMSNIERFVYRRISKLHFLHNKLHHNNHLAHSFERNAKSLFLSKNAISTLYLLIIDISFITFVAYTNVFRTIGISRALFIRNTFPCQLTSFTITFISLIAFAHRFSNELIVQALSIYIANTFLDEKTLFIIIFSFSSRFFFLFFHKKIKMTYKQA